MSAPNGGDIADLDGTRFRAESGELEGPDGTRARLAPQPARLLALLVAHRGSVVSRKTIGGDLWPAGAVDIDAGIRFAIREIRKGLDAAGGDADLIETIPRRGYRVRPAPAGVSGPATAPSGRARGWTLVALLAALAVTATISWGLRSQAPPTIAVFPYEGTTAGGSDGPLANELGTRVTTRLTNRFLDRLGVIGPNGVADLSGPDDTEGAAALGACLVLSGSARNSADTGLIVFTQIVRTSDRVHLWAQWDTIARDASLEPFLAGIATAAEVARDQCEG